MIYEVFARKNRGEALRHIGSLNAADDGLARVYAYQTYDEDRWFDMWIMPRERMLEVFNREVEDGTEWWHELGAGASHAVPTAEPADAEAVGAFGNVANAEP